jgi:cysteine desulfurase
VDGEALLGELDRLGFATNSGSSCTSSTLTPSHVLVAMGVLSQGNVRISLTRDTTEADVEALLTAFGPAVATVRQRHASVTSHVPGPPASATSADAGPRVLDYRGRPCPAPVMALAAAVLAADVGEIVTVEADDPAAPGDVAAWARMREQELVGTEYLDDGTARISVRRIA